mmetsp:Transcript_18683/g.17997  ORF Transcript_18683/g.17997 Transcript_18683/m.17997 type:complete len:405 (-) Transcript_18683:153-1367(-)|eukprot:CAMPEP_0197833570 /NCGR_PEP_ID=MMETSP1437-20131217/19453_1 /TAXON_ID=49252 ORGANISM="Eucampia antarctica, Strain CCMP1452" /NCGR_SAMPLE_ID=MMETSP1437 /ASSEMBLY_ACC=CAM_ASM_001096 /LENGTH=404 /DNA_ID=CAMNT_0043437695 /DNA_START=66 /DNA_END=1280 /DNA_ORIENTATION=+
MPVSLATTVASIPFPTCVYNASGPRTGSSAAMSKIATSRSGGVLAKSATLASQPGNPLPRTWNDNDELASLNSEGLPNAGIDYYIKEQTIMETMGDNNSDNNKPYMVSISGHKLEDNLEMLRKIASSEKSSSSNRSIAAVELNLACPNVIGKPIIAYDFEQMEHVLEQVSALYDGSDDSLSSLPPLGIKLPPYLDGPHFERAAAILNKYKHVVKYVATINTIGNAFAIDMHAEMPVISSKGGFAGLSGKAVKFTAMANVRKLRELLSEDIDVVGVGGITSGQDAFEMILCGATAVQVGTCHWTEGPSCFDRICQELEHIMEAKGYTTIQQFSGKLKPWSKEGAKIARLANSSKKSKAKDQKQQQQSLKQSSSSKSTTSIDFYQILSAILSVVVAILLADKFQLV